ncbi:MAG: site-specific integrase [Rikenellaceae bacterium]|nr:site-specific integrase [Rikenellaceae bacterium]MCL2692965.1 site-specific integrase [Rikenellaceae bacterium]
MRSTFKVLFYLKKNAPKPNGKVPVMGRITVNGNIAQFSCKFDIDSQLWDMKSNRAAGKGLEAQRINRIIDNIRVQITRHYQRISDKDAYVSATKVRDAYMGMGEEYKTLLSLFQEHNDSFRKHVKIDRAQSTFRKYRSVHAKLADFIKLKYRTYDIPLKELEPEFIENFALYLMTDCGLTSSSSNIYLRPLKRMVTIAHNRGWISRNPFADYRLKMEVRERGFLKEDQLQRLMTQKLEFPGQDLVRDMFLFSCFCGLAHVDLKNLTHDNIVTEANGSKWIDTKRQKTNVPTAIRLLDVPLELMKKYACLPTKDNKLFDVPDLAYCNRVLKEIAKQCEFDMRLSYHIARHTFATTVTLSQGVPLETVSKMLGHTSIKTTQIYAKITRDKIGRDMEMLAAKIGDKYRFTDDRPKSDLRNIRPGHRKHKTAAL